MPQFKQVRLHECSQVSGMVIAIDVLRAFSTAAYAFAAGATRITLAGTVEEALALRAQFPDSLLLGEVYGLPVDGFDFGNSPSVIAEQDLTGRELVQRTSAGTQGIVLSERAETLLAASFCCASATGRYIARNNPAQVTFVITGAHTPDHGDEDAACADYIQALVTAGPVSPHPYLERVRKSDAARNFLSGSEPHFPTADLDYCLRADIFDFAMVVERDQDRFVMKRTLEK